MQAVKVILIFLMILVAKESEASSRFIALNPMVAEWAAEILGQEEVLSRLVASSEYSIFPPYLKAVPSIGPYPNLQIEKIASLTAEMAIGSAEYNRPDQMLKLQKMGIKTAILPKEEFGKMRDWILELGQYLGEPNRAKLVAEKWEKRIQKIISIQKKKQKKQKSVFFLIQNQPLITVGKNSFISDAFELAGRKNVFSSLSQPYPKVSKEAVISKNPDEILYFEMVKNQKELEQIRNDWKNKPISVMSGDDFSRCSLRLLAAIEGLVTHE
jgi:ABC-type Fe3+-hydroxamate transport system substrate-binding protein